MINRNFRLAIFIRVALIVLLAEAIAFIIVVKPMFFVLATAIVSLIAVIINLIRYIEKTNKDLTHFLLSIRQGAFTESYTSGNRGVPFQQFSDALNEIVREFAKVNEEKELHYQFLKTLNENINVAILSFDDQGQLMMMNSAAKRLLELPMFTKLEHFKKVDPALFEAVNTLAPELRTVVKVVIREELFQMSVQLKEIVLNGKPVKIVLLQNLNNELETKEIEAWHQLIRVLTHEIMNSVTPIASLSGAIESILRNDDGKPKTLSQLSDENMNDVLDSLSTIKSRSKGLLKFVTAYKEFARPLDGRFEQLDVVQLLERVILLVKPELERNQIEIEADLPEGTLMTQGDASLLDQVFINLLKNASEAVAHDGSGRVRVIARLKNQKINVVIWDNGPGIDEETFPRIFVPFFTTKAQGSGIGLSLSRQIIKLHNGTIKAQSNDKGTAFIVEW